MVLRARVASNLERAAARLRDASWRRAVLGPLHEALVITDLDGELLEVDDELRHLLGVCSPDELGRAGLTRTSGTGSRTRPVAGAASRPTTSG